jgi:tRNA modification GTPase
MSDTIAAISTGNVISAIGIIRLSGDDAINIANRIFNTKSIDFLDKAQDRKLYFGELLSAEGNVIDRCLCTVSHGPHSYTGENTVEFQCHGSPVVLNEGLRSLFKAGARQALAGEFTKRAFLNHRIDLIDAETPLAAENAAGQLGRAIGRKTDAIYDGLVQMISHFQAVIDYPDEDIDDFALTQYTGTFENAENTLAGLYATFDRGRIMRDGVPAAIIGKPNTGKSSLLNALLGYDRAIVTSIAGTTRDTVEEKATVGGIVLRLADTAGMRETEDTVEKIGVDRAKEAAKTARLVIAVFDGSKPLTDEDREVMEAARTAEYSVAVINKLDIERERLFDLGEGFDAVCRISAKTGEGLDGFSDTISGLFGGNTDTVPGEILTNARQAEAVGRALDSVRQAKEALTAGMTPDAVLSVTETACAALGELTGRSVKDDIIADIFSRFCVGK